MQSAHSGRRRPGSSKPPTTATSTRSRIAKELDVQRLGIPVTVANTTYMGMNVINAEGGLDRLPVYQYLIEDVKMDSHNPDTLIDFTPWSMLSNMATSLPSNTLLTMVLIYICNSEIALFFIQLQLVVQTKMKFLT